MLNHHPSDVYRCERKFIGSTLGRSAVEAMVRTHPGCFREVFHERFVNNVYLDTITRHCYRANVDGHSYDRTKVRIRWYGDACGPIDNPILELKIKQGQLNCKRSFALPALSGTHGLTSRTMDALLAEAGHPEMLRQRLLGMEAVLLNRYRRRYFTSPGGSFRITVDSDLQFFPCGGSADRVPLAWTHASEVIIELKYLPENDRAAREILQHFPFRLARCSKYVMGLERLARFKCYDRPLECMESARDTTSKTVPPVQISLANSTLPNLASVSPFTNSSLSPKTR